jgi:hypothetical protein
MRRPLTQFSLLALLCFVAVCNGAAYWISGARRVAHAELAYNQIRAGADAGVNSIEDIYTASVRLLDAQLWFRLFGGETAYEAHYERMAELERLCNGACFFDDSSGYMSWTEQVAEWRHEAEKWVESGR